MKRILIFIAVVGLLGLGACKRTASTTPGIVTSGYVPYTLTRQLAGSAAPITLLLPPGAEPHSFEPTPGVLVQLKDAKALVYTSAVLEPWVADLARLAGPGTRVLELAQTVPAGKDPHIWMNLANTQQLARRLAALLIEIDPSSEPQVNARLAQLEQELTALQDDFKRTLGTCIYTEVVHIGHLAFDNLLTPYGIKLTSLSGSSHEGEHSVKKMAEIIRQIQALHLPAVFTEETLSARISQTVSAETGAEILYLHPIEHISKQDFEREVTFTDLMRRNLESLKRGLQCQAS